MGKMGETHFAIWVSMLNLVGIHRYVTTLGNTRYFQSKGKTIPVNDNRDESKLILDDAICLLTHERHQLKSGITENAVIALLNPLSLGVSLWPTSP